MNTFAIPFLMLTILTLSLFSTEIKAANETRVAGNFILRQRNDPILVNNPYPNQHHWEYIEIISTNISIPSSKAWFWSCAVNATGLSELFFEEHVDDELVKGRSLHGFSINDYRPEYNDWGLKCPREVFVRQLEGISLTCPIMINAGADTKTYKISWIATNLTALGGSRVSNPAMTIVCSEVPVPINIMLQPKNNIKQTPNLPPKL